MFSKNYYFVFFASLFVAGFIFLSLPDKAFTQEGCCSVTAANPFNCIEGITSAGCSNQSMFPVSFTEGNVECNTQFTCGPLGCCPDTGEGNCGTQIEGECEGWIEGVDCADVPICNMVVSSVPTLNQWGLISVAGLLGLFSLFIIIRRHKYNVG